MPLFISYSHSDRDFVTRLAAELALRRRHVWVDTWEVNVGESLIEKIQSAITDASALLVVLSPAFVASAWCQKELNAGLMRELSERRILVLPVLAVDCQIPLFLREKRYADFRKSFEAGFEEILGATASISSDSLGRSAVPGFLHDWAVDWNVNASALHMTLTAVSHYDDKPYSVLIIVDIRGNEHAAKKFAKYIEKGLDHIARALVLISFAGLLNPDDLQILIADSGTATRQFVVRDTKTPMQYEVRLSARRLGEDSPHDLLYDYGEVVRVAAKILLQRGRRPTQDEMLSMVLGEFHA